LSLEPRTLRVEFSTEAAFRSEYLSNIANGGIFVASDEQFEVRETVLVELNLAYCDQQLELPGEVVHSIPAEMVDAGGLPGVAIQFTIPAKDLRAEFEPLVGVVEGNERITRSGRRAALRSPARVRLVVNSQGRSLECRSRDISSSGMLVSVVGEPIAVGDPISMLISHPQSDEQMHLDGTVVRHMETDRGEVAAMGVEFHTPEARQTEIANFINDVRAAEHSRRLGGISGPIAELGIENLLQMFGASSPQGTLTVNRGAEEGFILFEGGMLLSARLGRETGEDALKRMLSWREGGFEFHARLEEVESSGEPVSLEGAILNALCQLDERERPRAAEQGDLSSLVEGDPLVDFDLDDEIEIELDDDLECEEEGDDESKPDLATSMPRAQLRPDCIFDVDSDLARSIRGDLAQTEEAVLDLAVVGMTVARMLEVIPEAEVDVYSALDALLGRRLITCRE